MPKSKSQKENVRAKSASPSIVTKPIPGKRILNVNVEQINVRGVSKAFLRAPITGWTSPTKLINSIQADNVSDTDAAQALSHIRSSLESIGKSKNVPDQLSRFANNCYNYSLKPKFSEDFVKLYTAKRGRIQDLELKEKSRTLSTKAIKSAFDITDKAVDVVKEFTLKEMDNDHHGDDTAGPSQSTNMNSSDASETELMGPSRLINHTPNLPKLLITNIENVQDKCHIAISNMPLSLMPLSLRDALNNNRGDQKALQGLGKFPNVLKLLKDLMAGDVQFENFPLDVWRFKSEALAWGSLESNFFSTIAIILTDFWGLFQRLDFNKSHERTFWTEYVIPIFKHFCIMNKGFIFSWCESKMLSHANSQVIPRVWNNSTEMLFADGVGRKDAFEVVIMESSGPFSTEYIDHSLEDTWKLITMTSNSLRIQCICDKITLTKCSLFSTTKWQVIELRSAVIPVTWDTRANMISVFELLATLQNEYDNQKDVLKKLHQENNFLDHVEEKDTVRYQFENTDIFE
ncbi:hypothetical protein G6F46_004492 [Rhizopus delemar]|nr:hypothetical protein G6F36_011360 [Rhizopus arrhizus]KAG1587371.1 hypothetical protein G6F48_005968 [Rhizopus delemar]KAG1617687.1 hypothetical protein G6F46_004492 [Rhizopus delemar]KAG1642602.1 hypothetical protein G6F44_004662 [Rhizopus delemar]